MVRVGSHDMYGQNDQCGAAVTAEQAHAGAEVVILCEKPICGVYLSIHQEPGGYLTFCEVRAYEPVHLYDTRKYIQEKFLKREASYRV